MDQDLKHTIHGTKNTSPIAKVAEGELNSRIFEMQVCTIVDQPNQDKYFRATEFYESVQGDRYRKFIVRHNLMEQFKTEDAAGLR
jgi:hypothetical protein